MDGLRDPFFDNREDQSKGSLPRFRGAIHLSSDMEEESHFPISA